MMQDGSWPDTSLMDPNGPYKGFVAEIEVPLGPDISAIGTPKGDSLKFTVDAGFGVGEIVSFSGSGTGVFDQKQNLFDVNLSVQGEINLKGRYGDLVSNLGLGSGGSLSMSGDKSTFTLTIGGQPIEVEVYRGTAKENLRDALERAIPGITSNPAWAALIEDLASEILEPALEAFRDAEQALYSDIRQAYWDVYNALDQMSGVNNLPRPTWPENAENCFAASTPVLTASGTRLIADLLPGDVVISYEADGTLVPGRVTRTFQSEVSHLLDVHGLKVTPGHVTLCGDGLFKGHHVPIIDILLSDGALVKADGSLVRMAINAPVDSVADAFVKVAVALTPEDVQNDTLVEGEMRIGTLLFDRDGTAVSVLDCVTAEVYDFDPETGLVAKPGEAPHPLYWYGALPRPEDYILRRSRETLEGILTDAEWEGSPSALIDGRLRQTMTRRMH